MGTVRSKEERVDSREKEELLGEVRLLLKLLLLLMEPEVLELEVDLVEDQVVDQEVDLVEDQEVDQVEFIEGKQ